ncbi:hypothetical protein HC028_02695 [Planosporangium flavigriseum]|nr:hypothetical protein [Planosporangium flavigriseum]
MEAVLTRSLGPTHTIIERFRDISYHLGVYFGGQDPDPDRESYIAGVQQAVGFIDAAIYELKLLVADDSEPVDVRAYDPDLWEHVKGLVEDEQWGQIASQTAIFVEDRVRAWAGHPKSKDDGELVGKGLYARVFADDSEYRLGRTRGEWEGWRGLAMGFAQALSNVDRHRIQRRDDARRYAIGVLGLGSLLLTQLRYEHDDHLHKDE